MEIKIEDLSFEEAFKKLEEIVKLLERGDCPLEKAMEYYDAGTMLKDHCSNELNKAKAKLEKIVSASGEKTEMVIG